MRVVAEQQMPFALKAPNAETRAAMAEANEIAPTRRARFGTATELFDDPRKEAPQVNVPCCRARRTMQRRSRRIGSGCLGQAGTT